jgi:hypothetical protein
MTDHITANLTRYSTADLDALVEVILVGSEGTPGKFYTDIRVEYWNDGSRYGDEDPYDRFDREEYVQKPRIKNTWGQVVLPPVRLASPKTLTDYMSDLQVLASMTQGFMPEQVVRQFMLAVAQRSHRAQGGYRNRRAEAPDWAVALVTRLAQERNLPKVRILPQVESPQARRKLTKEERIDRYLSDGFYGSGGELEGPSWAWASGDRSPTGKWANRIYDAREYYRRELYARQKYLPKLRDLGVEPEPYESFSDYLRRMADKFEEG